MFIATNVCKTIFIKSFSFSHIKTADGSEYEGALVSAIYTLLTKPNKFNGLIHSFIRSNGPNLCQLIASALVMVSVVYYQAWRCELALSSKKMRGIKQPYPVKLLYTSNISVILMAVFLSNVYFWTQVISIHLGANPLVSILGRWDTPAETVYQTPVSGIAYYLSAPQSPIELKRNPLHVVVYTVFVLSFCTFFSRIWINISGTGSKDVARTLMDQELQIEGLREESMINRLN